jgi:hypothetical protein
MVGRVCAVGIHAGGDAAVTLVTYLTVMRDCCAVRRELGARRARPAKCPEPLSVRRAPRYFHSRMDERLKPGVLLYEKPELGRHYFIKDNALEKPLEVSRRCLTKDRWILGAPYRSESWPGMRAPDALLPEELARIEAWIISQLGVRALLPPAPELSHNHVQLVGGGDSVARPHVDSRALCDLAGVLFLHPFPATKHAGTSFFRLRLPDGTLDGNICPPPHNGLHEALGVRSVPIQAWVEEVEVTNTYNRLLVYRPDLVHSATSYFGTEHTHKRLTAVFFWKIVR